MKKKLIIAGYLLLLSVLSVILLNTYQEKNKKTVELNTLQSQLRNLSDAKLENEAYSESGHTGPLSSKGEVKNYQIMLFNDNDQFNRKTVVLANNTADDTQDAGDYVINPIAKRIEFNSSGYIAKLNHEDAVTQLLTEKTNEELKSANLSLNNLVYWQYISKNNDELKRLTNGSQTAQ